jgi:hypothetical protein
MPLRLHWNVIGVVPFTPTAKVAVLPSVTVVAAGCVTIDGAVGGGGTTGGALTLTLAALLVTLPAPLLTTTL